MKLLVGKINRRRSGVISFIVLALLGCCSVILLQLLSTGLQQRSQLRRDLQQEQTQWLLRAGVENAVVNTIEPGGDLPKTIALKLPDFADVELRFSSEGVDSKSDLLEVAASIGKLSTPVNRTLLSTRFKISPVTLEPNQE
jgi:uncharacterized protein YceK